MNLWVVQPDSQYEYTPVLLLAESMDEVREKVPADWRLHKSNVWAARVRNEIFLAFEIEVGIYKVEGWWP